MKKEKKLGVKDIQGKVPVAQIFKQFPNTILLLAKASEFGHNKYKETDINWDNWKNVEDAIFNYNNARARHLLKEGDDLLNINEESGLPHIVHTLWNNMALIQLLIEQKKIKL